MQLPAGPTPPQAPPAAAAGGLWHLRLLGAFELSNGRQRHGKLGTRAAMALLARLCLQPDAAHPRETLVELLWPEVAAAAGKQRLRQTLLTLKQVLEPAEHAGFQVIEADRFTIRLIAGRVQCDAVVFEAAFKRGEHDQARALYTGELLPGFYDEWIGDERLRLEGLFDRLRAPSAPTASFARLASDPGDPGAATARSAPPALPTTGPRHAALPAYLTRMVGADPQARQLRQAVSEHRLVTLMGPGGTGKTRLAVEVAQAMSAQCDFETVAWLPLAPCRTRQQVLDQVLLSLNLPTGQAGALAGIVSALDGRRALLVLDNFEQVVDEGAEVVGELGARLPLLHQLVTSRRALALPGEREILVAALDLPAAQATLDEAASSPAVALFVERARATRAEFHLHAGNRAAVIELLQLLDGMPLAIELAAARVRSMTPAEMAATLRQAREGKASALDLLERAPQRGRQDSRHHSMQATIEWSWALLGEAQRALLAALTVFQGGFGTEAAAAVCATSTSTPAGSIAWLLDELLAHSLLRLQAEGDTLRFALYEPIREFAQRQLSTEAAIALRRSHGAWALAWAQALPVTPSLPTLQAELPNLVAAMSHALADAAPQRAIALALALDLTLEEVKLPGAALATLASALEVCQDAALKSRGLGLLGLLEFLGGHGIESLRRIDEGLALAPLEPAALRARALLLAAQAAYYRKQASAALALLDEAQALIVSSDTEAQARIASCRADVVSGHDPAQAAALQRSAQALWSARGDRVGVMRARYRLAILAYDVHDYQAMWAEIDPVVEEARQLQAWLRLAASLNVRGGAQRGLRRWSEAAADMRASMQLAWQALAPRHLAAVLTTLPYAMLRIGQAELGVRLAGFISVYWPPRFGPLPQRDVNELRRVQRLAQHVMGPARSAAAYAAGQRLSVAEVVAQVLAVPAAG
ncbi:ATP-binding protein [Aquabacterium sp.]|uniref:ATP-binding protein n=1 Tax=Aquabacterium sp. TaxID=1872578 RepID=UPI002C498DF5|nr:NB-ARC domain-containing protein [Aquabacterium sp.]HSW08323.1 NB-ARC domain-containing protein [Aquabacterium sp.]